MNISAEQLEKIDSLYGQGLFLQAHREALELGPLAEWQGTPAMLLAGRLATQLGGNILGSWLIRRAWRGDPTNDEARYFYAYWLLWRRAPYPAWRWVSEAGEPSDGCPPRIRADWWALRGMLAGALRDFDTAESWLNQATELAPGLAWLEVCRAKVLKWEDRYEAAIAAARRALELSPWYCPAVECMAHLFSLVDRDAEAEKLLTDAAERMESASMTAQLYAMQVEARCWAAAAETLRRWATLVPLADRPYRRLLAAQRSEVAYHLGDIPAAIAHAKQAGYGFFKTIAERLEDAGRARAASVFLPVGFVRQHRMTCGPATLSAISRFWAKPADHLQVAEEICYNGTSAYSERNWAATHGWAVR